MSETVESRKGARDIKAECKRLGIVPDALCESCGYAVAVCDHQPAILAYRVALAARDEELTEAKAALEKARAGLQYVSDTFPETRSSASTPTRGPHDPR